MAKPYRFKDLTESGLGAFYTYDPDIEKLTYTGKDGVVTELTKPEDIAIAERELAKNMQLEKVQFDVQQRQKAAATPATPPATPELSSTDEAALQDFDKFSQRRDLQRSLGPAALIGGLGAAAQLGQAFAPRTFGNLQDRYAAEELDRLQAKQARGQLGLTDRERDELERQQLDPVRRFARESQRQAEAERASTGVVTTAAGQVRGERERQRLIADQARQAGATIAQADMAKAQQELQKMESLIAFRGQRQRQAIANLQKTGMDIAYLAGLSRAGKAMEQIDPATLTQATGGDVETAVALSKDLSKAGGITGTITDREINRILEKKEYSGLSDEARASVMETYKTKKPERKLADVFTQGQQTQKEAVGLSGDLDGPASDQDLQGLDVANAAFLEPIVDKDTFRGEGDPRTSVESLAATRIPDRTIDREIFLQQDAGATSEQIVQFLINEFGFNEQQARQRLGI